MSRKPYHIIDLGFQGLPEVIAAFLLETTAGYVLVESGPHSCWPTLTRSLDHLGIKLKDIQHVLLTHIHLDHAGAAWALAEHGATIHVHPAGVDHLHDPSRLIASAKRIYLEQMDKLWGEMKAIPLKQLNSVFHQQVISIGEKTFVAHHTPGHAIHHIAWQLDEVLFTGDVAGICIGDGLVSPPCPPPEFDLESWKHTIQLMRELPVEELVLTHFGPVKNKRNHLQMLEAALEQWVNFFTRQEVQVDLPTLTDQFITYIHQDFYEKGMDSIHRDQYDKANPPWMSVVGITRYLQKMKKESK
ncbi:MAG: MBL fold metallo-hydrolase [Saprospiraceae bacterium]|nr:MBL fold metallo-hydrolase [Saprospiraceae bacterium]